MRIITENYPLNLLQAKLNWAFIYHTWVLNQYWRRFSLIKVTTVKPRRINKCSGLWAVVLTSTKASQLAGETFYKHLHSGFVVYKLHYYSWVQFIYYIFSMLAQFQWNYNNESINKWKDLFYLSVDVWIFCAKDSGYLV